MFVGLLSFELSSHGYLPKKQIHFWIWNIICPFPSKGKNICHVRVYPSKKRRGNQNGTVNPVSHWLARRLVVQSLPILSACSN